MKVEFKLNGQPVAVEVDGDTPLLWVIRDNLGFTGTKYGCGEAMCGVCTVHLNGVAARSCVVPIEQIQGKEVTTIEGIGHAGALHEVQKAWIAENVPQCGYCQPGQIMSAVALLKAKPNPTDDDIDVAMSGNLCRCGTYSRIRKAIHRAAQSIGGPG